MEIVANIWDLVLIVDDLIELKVIDEYAKYLDSLGEKSLAHIETSGVKFYDSGTGVFQSQVDYENSKYSRLIINSGLVPILPNHEIKIKSRMHTMRVGSLMETHTDDGHSIAVTTYITGCVGGELIVKNKETGELAKIEPKRGRTVILKCDTPHKVLEVADGERKSLQTFITYCKEDNDE